MQQILKFSSKWFKIIVFLFTTHLAIMQSLQQNKRSNMPQIPYIIRDKCAITSDDDLEILISKDYPIFCGCVSQDSIEQDIIATQTFAISKQYGVIQLKKLIPLDMLYQYGHDAGSVGNLWETHHIEFSKFIIESTPKNVLEIGGGHSKLALNCLQQKEIKWSIVEPNPTQKDDSINYIESFFTKDVLLKDNYDTIVHSHTFEHIYDPHSFLADIASTMGGGGGENVFLFPKHEKMARKKMEKNFKF